MSALLSAALAAGASGSGQVGRGQARRRRHCGSAPPHRAPPDFVALDRLLEVTGAAGAAGPAGYVIAQLLGQTS